VVDYIVSGAGSEEGVERKQDRAHEDPALDKGAPAGSLRYFYGDSGGFAHVQVTGGGGRGASLLCLCCALSVASSVLVWSTGLMRSCIHRKERLTFGKLTRAILSWPHSAASAPWSALSHRRYTTATARLD